MFNEDIRQTLENFLLDKVSSSFNWSMCYMEYYSESDDCSDEDFSGVCEACNANNYRSGVTKVTLFYNDLPDWVIKVPILGNYYEEDECHCDYECSGSEKENDYCLTEVNYTQEAVESGLGNCFAKTYYVCTINEVDFYCSERVAKVYNEKYPYKSKVSYTKPNSLQQAEQLMKNYDSFLATEELALFIDAYGESIAKKLIKFLLDFDISDLHHGNLGFDANDHIKIIDCAGWRDQFN